MNPCKRKLSGPILAGFWSEMFQTHDPCLALVNRKGPHDRILKGDGDEGC